MRRNYLKLIVIFLMVCSHPVSAGIFGHWFNQCQSLGARKVNIHTIQGTDDVSPIVGQDVEVQGIITAVAPQLKGFFIQEEAKDMDGNPKTSEGLFVFSQILPDIEVGHIVSVRGEVQEHFGMTQIKAIGVSRPCGKENIQSVTMTLPLVEDFDWETIEGMHVEIKQPTVILNTYNFTRYNELTIGNQLLMQPTDVFEPRTPEASKLKALNARSQVIIDDMANGAPSLNQLLLPLDADDSLRIGSTLTSVRGVVDFSFERYRIRTSGALTVSRASRPEIPKLQGDLRIASFNVLNLFNGNGQGNGFPTQRGADTIKEYNLQLKKIVNTILTMDAHVVGLNELENDGFDASSSIAQLVDALNQANGKPKYDYIGRNKSAIGNDSITVGIIYQPEAVSPQGNLLVLTGENSPKDEQGPLFDTRRNRPSFTQIFQDKVSGRSFVVNVNHLKSKGSSCGIDDDSMIQGNCNGTRTRAAQGLTRWLSENFSDMPIYIVGDLNSYAKEDPIKTFESTGLVNTVNTFNKGSYTYSFRGEVGSLDYVLANQPGMSFVVDAKVWHSNAAEPIALDYKRHLVRSDRKKPQNFRNDGPYRASDHDAVIIGVSFK